MIDHPVYNQTQTFALSNKSHPSTLRIRMIAFTFCTLMILGCHIWWPESTQNLRQSIIVYVNSGYFWLSRPMAHFNRHMIHIHTFIKNYTRMHDLEQQILNLKQWQNQARLLQFENAHLKKNLRFASSLNQDFITGQAYLNLHSDFTQSMTLRLGEDNGVALHQPVFFHGRLIGRIYQVTANASQVLLLTDSHARTPVQTEHSHMRSILCGTNSRKLLFLHNYERKPLSNAELVFTTGEGGMFASGYLIGKVVMSDHGDVYVDHEIEWYDIDYVQVLKIKPS